jgi:predicted nuclease of predicted toxin-antitoxin system
MKVLLDHCVPQPLKNLLPGHEINHAFELGWQELRNGELLAKAAQSFDLLITSDKNIAHQQIWSNKKLAVLVLWTNNWPELRIQSSRILLELESIVPGSWRHMS